ncbi:MAG TPA: hypothetical protein VHN79_00210 [Lacunisphaera sp.]|nr:hypothetical protein [Lacunisphaera sp.]
MKKSRLALAALVIAALAATGFTVAGTKADKAADCCASGQSCCAAQASCCE